MDSEIASAELQLLLGINKSVLNELAARGIVKRGSLFLNSGEQVKQLGIRPARSASSRAAASVWASPANLAGWC